MHRSRSIFQVFPFGVALVLVLVAVGGCERLRGSSRGQALQVTISSPAPKLECASGDPLPPDANGDVKYLTKECEYEFPVHISAPLDHDLNVFFITFTNDATVNGEATGDDTRTKVPDLKTISPNNTKEFPGTITRGQTTGSIKVKILSDRLVEPTEKFTVLLWATSDDPQRVRIGEPSSADGYILDDQDPAPVAQFADLNNTIVPENIGVYNLKLFLVNPTAADTVTTTLDKRTMMASGYILTLPISLTVNGQTPTNNDITAPAFISIPAYTLNRDTFNTTKDAWIDVPISIRDDSNPNSGNRVVAVTVGLQKDGSPIPGVSAPKNLNKLSTTFTLVETDGLGGLNDTGVTQCADDTKYVDCALPTTQAAFPAQDAHLQTPFNFDTTVAPGCVLDRTTGLLWELKLADQNNLTPYRNMSKIYNWYEPAGLINGDVPGIAGSGNNKGCALGVAGDTACTTYEYIKRVNADKLCGHATWRLPKLDELVSLVDYSFSKSTPYSSTNCIAKRPLISSVFMNTAPGEYWTATSAAVDPRLAWVVNFGQNVCQDTQLDGATRHVVKGADDTYARYVRLVAKYQPQP